MIHRLLHFMLLCFLISCQQQTEKRVDEPKAITNALGQEITLDSLDTFLEKKMAESKVPGISMALINEGKVVYKIAKGYANTETGEKVSEKSIFEGASLSKPLFAYFTMMYVEEGLLDLDTPLYQYLPNEDAVHDDRYKKITARRVLSHTTGFPNWRNGSESSKLSINFEPGSTFGYSGEAYQYLGKVLAKLSNTDDKGLEALFQEKVAQPFDLRTTKFIQDTANMKNKVHGHKEGEKIAWEENSVEFGAAYSIHSEAGDFAKWLIVLLEEKGLTTESFEALFTPQIPIPEDDSNRKLGVTDWTLGFAKAELPYGTFYAHGGSNPGFSSLFAINREKKWGFILFSNADQSLIALDVLNYLHAEK